MDGSREHIAAVLWRHGMVERGQHHIVADEGAVADVNAALILELAAHIEKDVLPDVDVFPAVGIKGRKQAKALVHRLAYEP